MSQMFIKRYIFLFTLTIFPSHPTSHYFCFSDHAFFRFLQRFFFFLIETPTIPAVLLLLKFNWISENPTSKSPGHSCIQSSPHIFFWYITPFLVSFTEDHYWSQTSCWSTLCSLSSVASLCSWDIFMLICLLNMSKSKKRIQLFMNKWSLLGALSSSITYDILLTKYTIILTIL